MHKIVISLAVLGFFLFSAGITSGQQKGPVDMVADGCGKEISTYCKNVTPGQGRVLACLYAYGDKLSNRCEYALYEASAQLERALSALSYLANECRDDLKAYCSGVEPGQGRLLNCMDKNKGKLGNRCLTAMKDVGMK